MQVLEVRDNGPGIPAEKLDTIFEPFYASKREGLGLGLICRSIVDSFGSRITVTGRPGCGACCNRLKSRNNLSAINMLRFSTEFPGRTYTFAYVPRSLATMTK